MASNFSSNSNKRFLIVAIGILILITLNLILIFITVQGKISSRKINFTSSDIGQSQDAVKSIRINDFKLCKPLLMVDIPEESNHLVSLKNKIQKFINEEKSKNLISNASVYLRILNNGRWLALNPEEKYFPASMFKLSILIACLKKSEDTPGFELKKMVFSQEQTFQRDVRNAGHYLKLGQAYSVKELLQYMIVNSDNEAANLLMKNLGVEALVKLCADLNINGDATNRDMQLSVTDISKFLRVLYNSSYLDPENSEFALDLLAQTNYADGIKKYVDHNITIVNKFGERGISSDPQLHETAIIYLDGNPVLLTIMTKGVNYFKLSGVIAEMSKVILQDVIENENSYNH